MENNETLSICSKCKGACCKKLPGAVFPEQFKEITVDLLIDLYNQGYQFDYWEGNPLGPEGDENITYYYIRPQTVNSVGKIVDPSWGGQCVFLTDSGCKLSFDERPMECKSLVASETFNCKGDKKYQKHQSAIEWAKYNVLIEEAIFDLQRDKD